MKKRLIFIAALCASVVVPVRADLTVQYRGASPYLGVSVTSTSVGDRLATGQYKVNIQGDTGNIIGAPGTVNTFCIDLCAW